MNWFWRGKKGRVKKKNKNEIKGRNERKSTAARRRWRRIVLIASDVCFVPDDHKSEIDLSFLLFSPLLPLPPLANSTLFDPQSDSYSWNVNIYKYIYISIYLDVLVDITWSLPWAWRHTDKSCVSASICFCLGLCTFWMMHFYSLKK